MVIRFLLTNCWSAWKNLKADSIAYKLSVVWWDLPLRRRIKTADSFGTIEPFNDLFAGAACQLFVCWVCVNDSLAGAACPLFVCWVCVNDPFAGAAFMAVRSVVRPNKRIHLPIRGKWITLATYWLSMCCTHLP